MNFEELKIIIQEQLMLHYSRINKSDETIINIIEKKFEEFLAVNPYHSEAVLRFAVFENIYFHDFYKPLEILKSFIEFESNNHQAILIMAFISYSWSYTDEDFIFEKINALSTNNREIQSMVEYMKSYYYNNNAPSLEKETLKTSISLYPYHVGHHNSLGHIYLREGNFNQAILHFKEAVKNVAHVYGAEAHDFTCPEEFINEKIRKTHLSKALFEILEEFSLGNFSMLTTPKYD